MFESSQWLEKNILQRSGEKNSRENMDSFTGLYDITETAYNQSISQSINQSVNQSIISFTQIVYNLGT